MYFVTIEGGFSSAHHLREYDGNCEKMHGHNWKVAVTFAGKKPGRLGMLVDFRKAKAWLKEVLDALDHTDLNRARPFDRINPTSENIACYIFREMRARARQTAGVAVRRVTVWESDHAAATYEER